jgi:hypothetical protein
MSSSAVLPLTRVLSLALCGMIAAGFASLSCRQNSSGAGEGRLVVSDAQSLKPSASPGERALLVLSGTEIPVDVKTETEGEMVTLRLLAKGQEVEVEKYRATAEKFELVQAASEQFEPPLPLIEYPVRENQTLTWKGKLSLGQVGKQAEAKIASKTERLNVKGFANEALRVTVELQFNGGGPEPTVRVLTFWFVEGKGVLKREFDKGSARLPAPPGEASLEKTGEQAGE